MKNTKTALVLVAFLFLIIVSVCPGLPQPANAQGTASFEGTWAGEGGRIVTVRAKGPGEYEVTDRGSVNIYSGDPTRGIHCGTTMIMFSSDGGTMKFFQSTGQQYNGHEIFIAGEGLQRLSGPAPVAAPAPAPPMPNTAGVHPAVPGPPPQNVAPLQRLQEAHHLSEQGDQYYLNKQWQLAAEAYKAALEKNPDDENIRENYELASKHLAAEEGRKGPKRHQEDITAEPSTTSPIKQLKGTEYHGTIAKGLSGEAAKAEAMKGFDTKGSLPSVVDLSGAGQRPEWPARVKNDQGMRALQKQQDGYQAAYQQKDKELSQVRQQMQTADPARRADLMVKAAQIKEDMAKAEYNSALKEKEIRNHATVLMQGSQ